jgi:hypothetical protein
LLEVSWKKEWPNHLTSTNPGAAACMSRGSPFSTRLGFLQAAFVCPQKTTRHIITSAKKLDVFFLISTSSHATVSQEKSFYIDHWALNIDGLAKSQ